MSLDTPAPLSIKKLSLHYRDQDFPALDAITLDITPGVMTAIVGPNGAGKSSLLKCSLGLMKPDSGDILFFGQPFESVRRKVAYVPQRAGIDWDFPISVAEVAQQGLIADTKFWHVLPNKKHKAIAMAALEKVGLSAYAKRQIGKLSGGQQQRMFLARAIAQGMMENGADLFILDEPFSGVDIETEKAIMSILRSLSAQGKTIIAVHHNLQSVSEYFDEVLLLNERIIAHGKVEHVLTDEAIKRTYLPVPRSNSITRSNALQA